MSSVAEGQYVTAGANLFEVIKLETLWVRVPVYVGLLDEIQTVPTVQVRSLDQPETESSRLKRSRLRPRQTPSPPRRIYILKWRTLRENFGPASGSMSLCHSAKTKSVWSFRAMRFSMTFKAQAGSMCIRVRKNIAGRAF